MKKIIIFLLFAITITSCGKSNNTIKSDQPTSSSGTAALNTYSNSLLNFEGNYDLVRMMDNNCGASIQIIRICDGLKLLSNSFDSEEFCNINKGKINSRIVTLQGNELKSVLSGFGNSRDDGRDNERDDERDRRNDPHRDPQNRIAITNTLILNTDRTLIKTSNFANTISRCVYLKR